MSSISQALAQYGIKGPSHLSQNLFTLVRQNPSTLTALAITGIVVARIYWKIIRVPTYLRGLPRVPFMFSVKSMFNNYMYLDKINTHYQEVCKAAFQRGVTDSLDKCPRMWAEWKYGTWQVILADPVDLKDFYSNHEKFEKPGQSMSMYTMKKFFGSSVGQVRTLEWKNQRKIINPAFRRGWATSLFSEPTVNLLSRFDEFATSQKPLDVTVWMKRATLDVLSTVIMGFNFDCINHPDSHLINIYERVMARALDPASNVFGGNLLKFSKGMKQFHRDLDEFNAFVYRWIDTKVKKIQTKGHQCESDNNDGRDLLEMMVYAQLKDPESFSLEDLRSNCTGFFVAGHETTANALVQAIYLLGMNQDVQEKARMEVISIMGDVKVNNPEKMTLATNNQQSDMRYLTCVIKECLRLYGASADLPREVMFDHTFTSTGLNVPKGAKVSSYRWGIQHGVEYWGDDASKFKPERFESLVSDSQTIPLHPSAHNFTWAPFGGGQRICIGQQFSIVEQRVILSALLLRYTWKIVGDDAAMSGTPTTYSTTPLTFQKVLVQLTRRTL